MPVPRRHALAVLTASAAAPLLSTARTEAAARQPGVLIVYLTRTRNTEAVARMIQARTGGTLTELRVATPYPADYAAHVDQVARENERGMRPPLAGAIETAPFGTLLLGFPTWGMQLPPPVKTFLAQADLRGKTVMPFNTHAGYGVGSGFATVRALCPGSTVLPGLSIEGGYERRGRLFVMQGEPARRAGRAVDEWLARHARSIRSPLQKVES